MKTLKEEAKDYMEKHKVFNAIFSCKGGTRDMQELLTDFAQERVTNALKEAAEKIEEQNVTVDAAYITETAINIGLRRAKNVILSLIKDKE